MAISEEITAWKHAFESDQQSILSTLSSLAWDFASYTAVVELVRAAPESRGEKRLSPLVMDLLARGFWNGSILAIRRLVDNAPLSGPRGVCSLRAMVNVARAARRRITRRVYIEEIAGLAYNYELTKKNYWGWLLSQEPGPKWVPREFHYESSQLRHAEFDWLAGVQSGTSSPDDLIREEVFDQLERRLSRLDAIADHATVLVAHSATDHSRQGRVLANWNLGEAKEALRQLTEIAELVGRWFCFSGVGTVLPTPQFNQFAYLDEPMLHGSVEPLTRAWDTFAAEAEQWRRIENSRL